MSPNERDGKPESERLIDPTLDAAWRTQSREEPPAHLDAAILAKAHRAVAAGPKDVALAEAREPERWWWPLAAAAVIGAIAFGVAELAPRDQTVPGETVVSDTPPATVRAPSEKPGAAAKERQASAPASSPQVARVEPAPSVTQVLPAPRSSTRKRDPAPSTSGSLASGTEERAKDESEKLRRSPSAGPVEENPGASAREPNRLQAEAPAVTSPSPPPTNPSREGGSGQPSASPSPYVSAPPATFAPAARAPRAFPAERKTEASADTQPAPRKDAGAADGLDRRGANAPRDEMAAAPAAAPEVAAAPLPAAPRAPAAVVRQSAQPPIGSAEQGRQAATVAAREAEERARSQRMIAQGSASPATVAPISPEQWVERIRALRRDGHDREAADELNAFRSAYPDADERLPRELREWATTIPKRSR